MQEDTRVRVTHGDHAGRIGTVRSASTEFVSWIHFDDDPLHVQWPIAHDDLALLVPFPTSEALEQLAQAAKAAGAEGMWMVRGALAGMLLFALPDSPVGAELPMVRVAAPHELIVLIRIPIGDGGESGVEVRM